MRALALFLLMASPSYALDFKDHGDKVWVESDYSDPLITTSNDCSVAVWVSSKQVALNLYPIAFTITSDGPTSVKFGFTDQGAYRDFFACDSTDSGEWPNTSFDYTFTADQLYCIVITYNGGGSESDVTFYVDGVAQTTDNAGSCGAGVGAVLVIGRDGNTDGSYHNGRVERVQTFDRELTAADAVTLYATEGIPFLEGMTYHFQDPAIKSTGETYANGDTFLNVSVGDTFTVNDTAGDDDLDQGTFLRKRATY